MDISFACKLPRSLAQQSRSDPSSPLPLSAGDPRPGVHATPSTYKPSTPLPAGGVNPPNTKQDGSTDSIDDSRATTGRSATARTSNVDSGARQRTELAAAAKLAAADYHTPPAGKPLSGGLMSMEGPGHALRPATVISARGVLGETSPEIKGESGGRAVASPAEEEGEEMDESRVYPSSTSGTAPATTQTSPPRETGGSHRLAQLDLGLVFAHRRTALFCNLFKMLNM